MSEQKEPKIYVDMGIVDMSELSPDKVPDDFWSKLAWFGRYNKRDDLEIHIFKDDNVALNRIYSLGKEDFEETRDRGLFDNGNYLSLRTIFFTCFSNYEDFLISRMIQLLQPEPKDENGDDNYLLEKINICIYMQKYCNGETTNVPDRLLPVDPQKFSVYENIMEAILESGKRNNFDGLHCEYRIIGDDRCSLCLFMEDSKDRWDGMRYQVNFHISLYQMPGVFSGSVEEREIQNIESQESYALDCIIANGDKCDSFADFRKWAEAFFFGYRVD